jgi:lipopolysaccharide transport system ATP-binding protein
VALNRTDAPSGNGASGVDREPAIVVERLSKSYPTSPVSLFPPVTSVFDRDLNPFRRKSSLTDSEEASSETITTARPTRQTRPPDDDYLGADDDLDDDDDDDDDEDLVESGSGRRTPWEPGELFWALSEVSLRVSQGAVFGVLGGPDSGKSTLLGILGGRILPTEGRALVRDPVSPFPAALAKALGLTSKGTFDMELVLASRLLGVDPRLVTSHRHEIEAMAAPLWDEEGEPARGAMLRLAMATAIVIPSNVVLLDHSPRIDEAFMRQVVERIPERVRNGDTVVLASRDPGLIAEVCDEAIVLHEGSIIEMGSAAEIGQRHPAGAAGSLALRSDPSPRRTAGASASRRYLSDGRPLDVPADVPPFNSFAAILSVTLRSASGHSKRIDVGAEETVLEIRFETARPDLEANCGVVFSPRGRPGAGIRVELPEPLTFVDPRTYVLIARIPPETLPDGMYEVAADAIVANPDEPVANLIGRHIGRVRFLGDEREPAYEDPDYVHWDGRPAFLVGAEWSIE